MKISNQYNSLVNWWQCGWAPSWNLTIYFLGEERAHSYLNLLSQTRTCPNTYIILHHFFLRRNATIIFANSMLRTKLISWSNEYCSFINVHTVLLKMLPGSVNYQYVSHQCGKTITMYCLTKKFAQPKKLLTVNYLARY